MKYLSLIFTLLALTISLSCSSPKENHNEESINVSPDRAPEFPGGEDSLKEYIANHIDYPALRPKYGITTTVVIKAVITKDGVIQKTEVVRSRGELLDNEAIRVVNTLPRFNPALKDGHPVDSCCNVRVRFNLHGYEDI